MADRLLQSVTPQQNTALVQVISGPFGVFKWNGDAVNVNGRTLPTNNGLLKERKSLNQEYVGTCIAGDCNHGGLVIFKSDRVLGVPLKQNAVIPPALPNTDPNTGADRSNPEAVATAYAWANYNDRGEDACELASDKFVRSLGGEKGCRANRQVWVTVGPEYDFNQALISSQVSEDGKTATVNLNLPGGHTKYDKVYTLVQGPKGWVIDSIENK